MSEFLVCQNEEFHQSVNIFHKYYIKQAKEQGGKPTPFPDSIQFTNYQQLVRYENILRRDLTPTL